MKLEGRWEEAEQAYREAQEEYFGTGWERVRPLISPEALANLLELKHRSEEAHAADGKARYTPQTTPDT